MAINGTLTKTICEQYLLFKPLHPLIRCQSYRSIKNLQFDTTLVPPEVKYVFFTTAPQARLKTESRSQCHMYPLAGIPSDFSVQHRL